MVKLILEVSSWDAHLRLYDGGRNEFKFKYVMPNPLLDIAWLDKHQLVDFVWFVVLC